MMYGFGDDQNPYTESVDFLEDLVIEFITETTHRWLMIFQLLHTYVCQSKLVIESFENRKISYLNFFWDLCIFSETFPGFLKNFS